MIRHQAPDTPPPLGLTVPHSPSPFPIEEKPKNDRLIAAAEWVTDRSLSDARNGAIPITRRASPRAAFQTVPLVIPPACIFSPFSTSHTRCAALGDSTDRKRVLCDALFVWASGRTGERVSAGPWSGGGSGVLRVGEVILQQCLYVWQAVCLTTGVGES